MNRFRFRLEVLLDLRKRREEKIKLLLAEKNNMILDAQKKAAAVHDALKELQENEKLQRGATLNPILLRYSISYRYKLKQDLVVALRKVDDLRAEAFKVQKELMVAIQKRRVVELVKERRYSEWKKKYNIHEQNFNDEISQQTFIRNNL